MPQKPHTHKLVRQWETERLLSPCTTQALQSPFEDFKNHLGLLSIFVKQANLKATVEWIQRERRTRFGKSITVREKGRKMSPKWNLGEVGMEGGWQQVEGESLWIPWFSLYCKEKCLGWNYAAFWPRLEIDTWFLWCLDIISVVGSDTFHIFSSVCLPFCLFAECLFSGLPTM